MPSLVAMLVGVAIAFFVVPRMAPNILMIVAALILAYSLYSHYTRFGVTEYERATWIHNINQYSGMIVFGIVLLTAYMMWGSNTFSSSSNTNVSMPALTMPTVGGGFDTVLQTSSSRIRELLRKGRITV